MTARGIRNNNSGNIRLGGGWAGLAEDQSDEIFCIFADMQHGIRALIKLLMAYWRRYGLNSVHNVISRYALSSENNTIAYENAVAAALGVKPHQKIDLSDPQVLFMLAKAIARYGMRRSLPKSNGWRGPPRRVGGLIYAHMKKTVVKVLDIRSKHLSDRQKRRPLSWNWTAFLHSFSLLGSGTIHGQV